MKNFLFLIVLALAARISAQYSVTLDTAIQRSILIEHNKERKLLNIPNLTWNEEIALYAEEWALQLAEEDNSIHHRSEDNYGENISWISSMPDDISEGVAMWNEEKVYFKYKPIGNDWAKSGHYTQVIWKNTTQVGCGCAVSKSGAFFFVCNYDPPGNYIGQKPY
jgi:pathogenesis-related protein 1